jgi:hypothetical protein
VLIIKEELKEVFPSALEKYHKINVFSDVNIFIPLFTIHVLLILFSVAECAYNDSYIVGIGMLTPAFIVVYIYCSKRIVAYNEDISKRMIIRGNVIEEIIEHQAAFFLPAQIEVRYKYIDPDGIEHTSFQKVKKQFTIKNRWNKLYAPNTEVDILLNPCNYSDSYLPLSEFYSKKYYKIYLVQLSNRY